MSARAITQELIDRLLAYFRSEGVNFTQAANHAGCTTETASKAFSKGWPRKGFRPLREVLLDEQLAARARIQAEHAAKIAAQEKERDDARKQAVEARAQEGQMIQLARASSLASLAVANQLLGGARKLAAQVRAALEAEAAKKPEDQLSPQAHLTLLARVVSISNQINQASHQAMQMERLHLGQPTQIIEMVEDQDMTLEEAQIRIAAAQQAYDSAQRAAKLTVIEGGAGTDLVADVG